MNIHHPLLHLLLTIAAFWAFDPASANDGVDGQHNVDHNKPVHKPASHSTNGVGTAPIGAGSEPNSPRHAAKLTHSNSGVGVPPHDHDDGAADSELDSPKSPKSPSLRELMTKEGEKTLNKEMPTWKRKPLQKLKSVIKMPMGENKTTQKIKANKGASNLDKLNAVEVNELREEVEGLNAAHQKHREKQTKLKARHGLLKERFEEADELGRENDARLFENQEGMDEQIGALQDFTGELAGKHLGLARDHEVVKSDFGAHKTKNSAEHVGFKNRLNSHEGKIGTMDETLARQGGRLGVAEEGLTNLGTKHGALKETVDEQGNKIAANRADIEGNRGEIGKLHARDAELGGDIEGMRKGHAEFVGKYGEDQRQIGDKFSGVDAGIAALGAETGRMDGVQVEHGSRIENLGQSLTAESAKREEVDTELAQKIEDETAPLKLKASELDQSLSATRGDVATNTGHIAEHKVQLDEHAGRLGNVEGRADQHGLQFERHQRKLDKHKGAILSIQQRLQGVYGNMATVFSEQKAIDENIVGMERELASKLAESEKKVEMATEQLAEANKEVANNLNAFIHGLEAKVEGEIGQSETNQAGVINRQIEALKQEEAERVQKKQNKPQQKGEEPVDGDNGGSEAGAEE